MENSIFHSIVGVGVAFERLRLEPEIERNKQILQKIEAGAIRDQYF